MVLLSTSTALVCRESFISHIYLLTKVYPGRTARIGHEGMATSFYNEERDSDLAADLVKILQECRQEIPDFLQEYITEDLAFDDDTDKEDGPGDENDDAGSAYYGSKADDDSFARSDKDAEEEVPQDW